MKAIVFDMDGVLFDTENLCLNCWTMVAQEQGLANMEEVFLQCVGRNANDTEILLRECYGKDFAYDSFVQEASKKFSSWIAENGMPVKPGVREILDYLKEAGYRIGLASSTKKKSVIHHLTEAGIIDYFSAIVTGDMVEHSKPNPDIYLLACEELQVAPEDAYAIEDSPNGIRAAHAAGMNPLMVPDLISPDAEMEALAFRIFKDLLEVRDFLSK